MHISSAGAQRSDRHTTDRQTDIAGFVPSLNTCLKTQCPFQRSTYFEVQICDVSVDGADCPQDNQRRVWGAETSGTGVAGTRHEGDFMVASIGRRKM